MEEENRKKTVRNKAEISQTEKVSNCTKSVFVEHRSTMGDKKNCLPLLSSNLAGDITFRRTSTPEPAILPEHTPEPLASCVFACAVS
jgi:hypothetical protein